MSVVLKKDEKIKTVLSKLPDNYEFGDFRNKFIELYEKDWNKIVKTYKDHLRKTKPGKSIPMPKPDQYLKNMLNVYLK